MEKTFFQKPFRRTIFFSLFIVTLLIISTIFTKSFNWTMLLCWLPMIVFFFIDDLINERKSKDEGKKDEKIKR